MFRLYGVDSNLIKIKLDTSDVSLRIDEAIPCGLIVNELVSNALTHAFPSGREGEIRISLSAGQDGEVTLVVRDNGGGFPKDLDFTKTDSLGIRLVTTLVDQLDGSIKVDGKDGTEIKITFTRRKE
jgi:two-component sensor histidine kinase